MEWKVGNICFILFLCMSSVDHAYCTRTNPFFLAHELSVDQCDTVITLHGIACVDCKREVLLCKKGQTKVVTLNDQVWEYTVAEIGADYVVLKAQNEAITLRMQSKAK